GSRQEQEGGPASLRREASSNHVRRTHLPPTVQPQPPRGLTFKTASPFSHEKVAEPSNLQSLRGAISDGRITRTHEPSTRPAVTRPTTQRPWLVTDPHGSEEASVERNRRPSRNVDGATPPSAPPARP